MAQVFLFGSFSEEEAAQNQSSPLPLARRASLSAARPEMPRAAGARAKLPQVPAEKGMHPDGVLREGDFHRLAALGLAGQQGDAVVRDKVILEVTSSSNPNDNRASHAEHDLLAASWPSQDSKHAEGTAWSAVPLAGAHTGDVRASGHDDTSFELECRNPPSTQSSLEARYNNGAPWEDGRLPPIVDKLPLPAAGPTTSASVQGAQPLHHSSAAVAPSIPAAPAFLPDATPAAGPSSERSGASSDLSSVPAPSVPAPAVTAVPVPAEAPTPQPPPKPSSWAALLANSGPSVQAPSRKPSAATPSTHVSAAPAAPQHPPSLEQARGSVAQSNTPPAHPSSSGVPLTPPVAAPPVAAREPEAATASPATQADVAVPRQQAKDETTAPAVTDPLRSAERSGSTPAQSKGLDAGGHSTAGSLQGKQSPGEGALGSFGPRGFENGGNLCFANATLQALLGSSSFIQLLDNLHQSSNHAEDQCPTVSCFVRFWRELHGEKGGAAKGRKAKNQAQESLSTPNRTQGQGQVLTGKTAAARPGVAAAASAGVAEGTATGAGEEPGTGASVGEGEADGREGEGESEEAQELDDASLKLLAAHLLQGSTRTGSGSAGGAVSGKERAGAKAGASGTSQQQGSGPKETMSYAALAKAGRSSRLAYLGPPLDPSQTFEDVLARFSPQHHLNNVQIRQEDAQEFLSYLLDRMHEELLNSARLGAEGHAQSSSADFANVNGTPAHAPEESMDAEGEDGEDDGWETVGKKNKTAVTRLHAVEESDVSSIFFGQLRSEIKTQGAKASATVQPFSVIQLDIARDSVRSVEDAMIAFGAPEYVEGYRPQDGRGSHPVMATKVVRMQALPRVLILHLMRFTYSARGSMKLHKSVSFPLQLTLSRDLVYSPPAVQNGAGGAQQGRTYKLFATVVHHGKEPSRGHYTANVRQPDDTWLRFDDASVTPISTFNVAKEQAYLLLYERT